MASYMGHEYTPAPTQVVQGRYRVGDRVRVVDARGGGNVGDVATVARVESVPDEDDYCFLPDLGPAIEGLFAYRLSPAFRPGDRVKLNRHSGFRACGERGTVSAVIGDNISVRMDDMSAHGTVVAFFHADNLDWERVEDCKTPGPKFKAGDVVTYKHDHTHRKTIKGLHTHHLFGGGLYTGERGYDYVDGGWDREVDLELVTAAPCPQDNEQPKHKFKAGDKVFHVSGSGPYTVDDVNESSELRLVNFLDLGYLPSEYYSHTRGGSDAPCIVALISNGKPRPSSYPHVHASVEAATKEAERLARNNPGQEFAVYQRVAGRQCEVSYEMKEVA